MEVTILGLQAALAMVLLEGIKQLVYFAVPAFNFNPKLYVFILPVLSLLVLPAASWLSGGAFDWSLWTSDAIRQTILTLLSSLVAMLGYNTTLKPFKEAVEEYKELE